MLLVNLNHIISSGEKLVSNAKLNLKSPVTYMKAWDNYSTVGGMVEGLHTLNLMSNKTYDKLIKIFDPET